MLRRSQLRLRLAFSDRCRRHSDAPRIEKIKLDAFPVPHIRTVAEVVRAAMLVDEVIVLADGGRVGGAELALCRDGDGAVPWGHGEVVGLRHEREGELAEANGAVDREADVIGEDAFDEGGEGLRGRGRVVSIATETSWSGGKDDVPFLA